MTSEETLMELTVMNVEHLIATAWTAYAHERRAEYTRLRDDALTAALAYGVPRLIKSASDLPLTITSPDLPAWASAEKYEYDLGMSTTCFHCDKPLKEGATVWRDVESSVDWARQGYPGLSSDLYCSVACVMAVEAKP